MPAKTVLYYGKDEPLPERIDLRAGPLSMVYENGDLRYIKLGPHEVLRRIYVAVRDQNWGTIPPVFSNIQMEIQADAFRISYTAVHQRDEIDFAWQGTLIGGSDGSLTFGMQGEARSTFMKNRIGFCVLHPASCADAPCVVEHVDGTSSKAPLPRYIVASQPVPPFMEMRALAHEIEPGQWAEVQFQGDTFEMEDQRNWTDASYKTFCTPLRIPFPVEIRQGKRIRQSVSLFLRFTQEENRALARGTTQQSHALTLAQDLTRAPIPLPPLGLGVASHGQPLSAREEQRLKALNLNHLRVDLDLDQPDYPAKLSQAAAEAHQLGAQLEVALLISPHARGSLERLAERVKESQPPITAWLVYPATEYFQGGSPVQEALSLAHQSLDGVIPGAKFAAGTNTDFIFLQRSLPPLDKIDALTLAINPQVHAFDNASLVETLLGQSQVIASAIKLAEGRPVRVSPVTFKMRFNPYATGPAPDQKPGDLPPQVDVRQMSLFGAGWALGSLSALMAGGAASLTFFETTGWRGVMETEGGSPLPEVFQSIPGGVYPLYLVFKAVGDFAGGVVVPSQTSDPLAMSALVLRQQGRQRILFANHTEKPQQIRFAGVQKAAAFMRLDETNVTAAMRNPEEFLAQPAQPLEQAQGHLTVDLSPYAIGWLDL